MCKISNSYVNGFQSWYFPDKPYCSLFHRRINVISNFSFVPGYFLLFTLLLTGLIVSRRPETIIRSKEQYSMSNMSKAAITCFLFSLVSTKGHTPVFRKPSYLIINFGKAVFRSKFRHALTR